MDEEESMQAPGDAAAAENEGMRGAGGSQGAGESGGGAYPSPYAGKTPKDGSMGHGGQTEIGYHGPGQLGDEETAEGDQPNSATKAG